MDELSNWDVRRSRRRFWDGEAPAFATLHTCLVAVAKLLAPFCPFIADEIYDNLDGELESVHLCDFPSPESIGSREPELEAAMAPRPRDRPPWAGRAWQGQDQGSPAARGGRRRGR